MDFLELNLSEFENFGINFPIGAFLVLFTITLCMAVFIYNYKKRYTATLIKQLIRHNAINEESAKTLKELHLDSSRVLKIALSRSGQLTYIVKSAGDNRPSYEEYVAQSRKRGFKGKKINFDEVKFYIPSSRIDKAKHTVETSNTEWWRPMLVSFILIAVLAILSVFLPDILQTINSSVK